MGTLTLLLGGARSGKSALAQQWGVERGEGRVLFIATAQALDEEMAQRIARHRAERPASWRTVEAPLRVGEALQRHYAGERVVIVDCITLLIGNVVLQVDEKGEEAVRAEARREAEALVRVGKDIPAEILIVSNEVGMGLVPPYPLGRVYRDVLGEVNQYLARSADRVYFLIAGIPWQLKP